jgi:hypothetical protein
MKSDKYSIETNVGDGNDYAIFNINGTPEKNFLAIPVINSYHEFKPDKKIIVITLFPEIWLHNKDVYRVYKIGAFAYFYDDYINGKNNEIYSHDPYLTSDFINKTKPIPEIWCEMIGIPYNGSIPKLYFTHREEEQALSLFKSGKPTLLIQGHETFPLFPNLVSDWTKDIPIDILQKISDLANSKGYEVIQIRSQKQPAILGAVTLTLNMRTSFVMLKNVKRVLAIDSYLQQACAAVGKQAVVTWLGTSPKIKGYKIHKNIIGKVTDNIQEKLENYCPVFDVKGEKINHPVIMEGVYNINEIIKALDL